ncbi:hypothetical protein BJX76DRAFT_152689 [Aspergillus varians]
MRSGVNARCWTGWMPGEWERAGRAKQKKKRDKMSSSDHIIFFFLKTVFMIHQATEENKCTEYVVNCRTKRTGHFRMQAERPWLTSRKVFHPKNSPLRVMESSSTFAGQRARSTMEHARQASSRIPWIANGFDEGSMRSRKCGSFKSGSVEPCRFPCEAVLSLHECNNLGAVGRTG